MDAQPRASWRQWAALAVLCLPTMLATVDISITVLALPHISADLGASAALQLWIADIYGFMIAGFLITMGTLGDRIGRRRVLLGGAALFIAASALAAFSTSTGMLIGARALIGIAGATIMPSVLALIAVMFRNPKQMASAMGIWGSSVILGLIAGPIVGGLLLGAFWWGSVFLIGIPVMGLLLLTGPFLLPEFRNPQAGRLDVISSVLSLCAILPAIYGITRLGSSGFSWLPVAAIVVGVAAAIGFVQRQRSVGSPLLDLKLFRIRALSAAVLLGLVIAVIMGGVGLTVTLFMQTVRGMSPVHVALWLIAPSIALVITGNLAMILARRVRPAYILMTGAVVGVAGLVVITTVSQAGGLATLITGLILVYIGGSPVGMMGSFLVMSSAPPEKAGSAGSVSATSGELGAALGVALLGVVANIVYRSDLSVPAAVPAGQAAGARASIVGALSIARHAHDQAGVLLLQSAREAFTSGLHAAAVCTAVLFVVLGAVAFLGLRQVPPTGAMRPPPLEQAELEATRPVG
jgi:DHA2 family multidrug resistance protein-like MFS transporter